MANRSGRLAGRVAIVTGAGQGIGLGIASVFAREGAAIVIADRNPQTGRDSAATIADQFGAETLFVETDVTDESATGALAQSALQRFRRLDILCHNAGIYPPSTLEEMTGEMWDRVLDTNLKSAMLLARACVPGMKAQGKGRLLFTSSITGPITGIAGYAHYGASKAGVMGFVRGAALEFAPYNITVNAVLPGNILSPGMTAQGQAYIDAQTRRIPLKRLGSPLDIGHAMLFLASDEADYLTGQGIVVDGGQTLPEA